MAPVRLTSSRGAEPESAHAGDAPGDEVRNDLGLGGMWRKGGGKSRLCFVFTLTPAPDHPPPPTPPNTTTAAMFWPCDKCFKLVLIMRVTEEEMEASAGRRDEWSIYFGGFL